MRTRRYPELARHAREHLEFGDHARWLLERSRRVDVSADMFAFIRAWRLQHVMVSDQHFADYLSTEGVASAPPTCRETTAPVRYLAFVASTR